MLSTLKRLVPDDLKKTATPIERDLTVGQVSVRREKTWISEVAEHDGVAAVEYFLHYHELNGKAERKRILKYFQGVYLSFKGVKDLQEAFENISAKVVELDSYGLNRVDLPWDEKLTAFYDSSFNPDPKDSKCHYGWVIYLCGGPIAWGSHKHNHVSPAVMHAEYCTVRPLGDCIIWMRKLCTELGFSEFCDEPVPTHGDNDIATGLIRENRHTPANRMILREFHLVQQYCRDGYIDPLRVNTKRNPSDLLTKASTEVDWNRTIDELRGLSPIDYVTLASDPDSASLSIELSPSSLLAVKDCPPSFANAV